jgi:putative transposase
MAKYQQLFAGCFYHINNRGNNGVNIFCEERNYAYFLSLYDKYVVPAADTFCYGLLPNHFHFLVRFNEHNVPTDDFSLRASRAFSGFFSTYTESFNKANTRSGSLLEKPFKRKIIEKNSYLIQLVMYIHRNPQKHGLINDFRDWTYSSYKAIIGESPTRIQRSEVLEWFGGRVGFVDSHSIGEENEKIKDLVFENLD